MKQIDPNDTIAIGFSVQYQLDDGRNLAFSSCIDAECDPATLNAALDKLVDAAERQQARVKVPKLKKELERMEAGHKRAMEDMFRLDQEAELANELWKHGFNGSGRRGEYKPSPAQHAETQKRNADRANAEITFKRYEEEIALRKAELQELTVAISSAADSRSGVPNS